jgi:hypothetical protein
LWPAVASRQDLCAKLTTNMSRKQWRDWVSPDIPYVKICEALPIPPTGDLPALITVHLTAPIPRPSQQRRQVPVAFGDVIARGMAKTQLTANGVVEPARLYESGTSTTPRLDRTPCLNRR